MRSIVQVSPFVACWFAAIGAFRSSLLFQLLDVVPSQVHFVVARLLCFLIVGIQASGISIPLSLLMLQLATRINNRPSSIAVETSRSTTQSDSIVKQTNKCLSCLSYNMMNNKHIFNDKEETCNIMEFFFLLSDQKNFANSYVSALLTFKLTASPRERHQVHFQRKNEPQAVFF